ncbi:hypothetical protein LshimejAT787_1000340 [Lyophyllum shimeji]|uniref:Uncharacterized protein n=1 Tax=Lyophyllum shimeji TaxID=47721 RepID=A0A9P3PTT1_LYOSH|nr:hypothetical protein LshimejAT787_1000340 [Lyophyllum shimeji]
MFCGTCLPNTSLVALAPGTDVYRLPNDLINPCIEVFIELGHTFTSVATKDVEKAVVLTYNPELRRARCLPSPAFAKLVLVLHCSPVYGLGGISRSKRARNVDGDSASPLNDLSESDKDRCTMCKRDLNHNEDEVAQEAQLPKFPMHVTEWEGIAEMQATPQSRARRMTSPVSNPGALAEQNQAFPKQPRENVEDAHARLSISGSDRKLCIPEPLFTSAPSFPSFTSIHKNLDDAALRLPGSNGTLCIPDPLFSCAPSFNSIQVQSTPPRRKPSTSRSPSPSFERREFLDTAISNSAKGRGSGIHRALPPSSAVECDVTDCWAKDRPPLTEPTALHEAENAGREREVLEAIVVS